ncbi:hypothetical protein [Actinoplanes sp. RD1]|uniref:hypothetical protein n=1 Tax=Actinoplanes sp. RD1 TaxID=3064538 RepID=UPI0027412D13|nr:hypothetical protein [Actinoplanes sp. RD1]
MDEIPYELGLFIRHPDDELSFNTVEALGLDGTGLGGDPRFPYTWAKLTSDERRRLQEYTFDPDAP